jgi:hypothetical protein
MRRKERRFSMQYAFWIFLMIAIGMQILYVISKRIATEMFYRQVTGAIMPNPQKLKRVIHRWTAINKICSLWRIIAAGMAVICLLLNIQ